MRALVLSCSVLLAFSATAQLDTLNASVGDTISFIDPQQPASFPGGEMAMWEFLMKRVKYPTCIEMEGTVYVQFTVESDSTLSNIHLKRGVAEAFDREALRVVSLFPQWNPALLEGKPVRSDYIVPIRFRL